MDHAGVEQDGKDDAALDQKQVLPHLHAGALLDSALLRAGPAGRRSPEGQRGALLLPCRKRHHSQGSAVTILAALRHRGGKRERERLKEKAAAELRGERESYGEKKEA